MKKICILPQLQKIEIHQHRFMGQSLDYCTFTPWTHWRGIKHYNWLWFSFQREFTDFNIRGKEVILSKKLTKKNVEIITTYSSSI